MLRESTRAPRHEHQRAREKLHWKKDGTSRKGFGTSVKFGKSACRLGVLYWRSHCPKRLSTLYCLLKDRSCKRSTIILRASVWISRGINASLDLRFTYHSSFDSHRYVFTLETFLQSWQKTGSHYTKVGQLQDKINKDTCKEERKNRLFPSTPQRAMKSIFYVHFI